MLLNANQKNKKKCTHFLFVLMFKCGWRLSNNHLKMLVWMDGWMSKRTFSDLASSVWTLAKLGPDIFEGELVSLFLSSQVEFICVQMDQHFVSKNVEVLLKQHLTCSIIVATLPAYIHILTHTVGTAVKRSTSR